MGGLRVGGWEEGGRLRGEGGVWIEGRGRGWVEGQGRGVG